MRRHFQRHDLRAALLTLAAASAVGAGLLIARVAFTGQVRQLYLVWNLVLAWVPLFLALRLEEIDSSEPGLQIASQRLNQLSRFLCFKAHEALPHIVDL